MDGIKHESPDTPLEIDSSSSINQQSPVKDKITIFRSLFQGREDVYPVRWEGKNGRAGYSPACTHEWNRTLCGRPKIKCADCQNRKLLPVTDQVIYDHLAGRHTVGVYPLLSDENCRFLAIDFDKTSWQEDVTAARTVCEDMNVPVAVERSRSGNGAHV